LPRARRSPAIAAPDLTDAIRRAHDFLTVGAPSPLQEAAAAALRLPDLYYHRLAADYRQRRDLMLQVLATLCLWPVTPAGAYYIMTDASVLGLGDDTAAARTLVHKARGGHRSGLVLLLPARVGQRQAPVLLRKKLATLREAGRRLAQLAKSPNPGV
jgi:aspartate/methionine/tyrosine aminotransferase